MSTDRPADTPDQRPVPLDIAETRGNPDVDEEKMGFQNIEGPGAETETGNRVTGKRTSGG